MKNIMVDDGIAPSSGIKLTFLSNLFVSDVDLYIKLFQILSLIFLLMKGESCVVNVMNSG